MELFIGFINILGFFVFVLTTCFVFACLAAAIYCLIDFLGKETG